MKLNNLFRRPGFWLLIITLCLLVSSSVMAQLNQSGGPGSSVTLQAGSALAGKFGVDQTTPGTTNGVAIAQIGSTTVDGNSGNKSNGTLRVVLATDQPQLTTALKVDGTGGAFPISGSITGITNTVATAPKTACGTTVASQPLAAVPTSSTAVFASTTCVVAVVLNNTTGSALTATVTDNQGTPINDTLTFSIPANSQLIQALYGIAFTSGLKWTASGSGVTGAVIGYQ